MCGRTSAAALGLHFVEAYARGPPASDRWYRPTVPTLLLIDDDDDLRDLLAECIRSRSIDVETCSSLAAARTQMASGPPTALLVDGLLPDGNGLDFIREARESGYKGRIFFMSAFKGFTRADPSLADLNLSRVIDKTKTSGMEVGRIVAESIGGLSSAP